MNETARHCRRGLKNLPPGWVPMMPGRMKTKCPHSRSGDRLRVLDGGRYTVPRAMSSPRGPHLHRYEFRCSFPPRPLLGRFLHPLPLKEALHVRQAPAPASLPREQLEGRRQLPRLPQLVHGGAATPEPVRHVPCIEYKGMRGAFGHCRLSSSRRGSVRPDGALKSDEVMQLNAL